MVEEIVPDRIKMLIPQTCVTAMVTAIGADAEAHEGLDGSFIGRSQGGGDGGSDAKAANCDANGAGGSLNLSSDSDSGDENNDDKKEKSNDSDADDEGSGESEEEDDCVEESDDCEEEEGRPRFDGQGLPGPNKNNITPVNDTPANDNADKMADLATREGNLNGFIIMTDQNAKIDKIESGDAGNSRNMPVNPVSDLGNCNSSDLLRLTTDTKDNETHATSEDKGEIEVSPMDLSAPPKDQSETLDRKKNLDTSTGNDEKNEIDVPVGHRKRVSLPEVASTGPVATTQEIFENSLNTTCVQCGKTLSSRANLIRHLKLHSDQRPANDCKIADNKDNLFRLTTDTKDNEAATTKVEKNSEVVESNITNSNKIQWQMPLMPEKNIVLETNSKPAAAIELPAMHGNQEEGAEEVSQPQQRRRSLRLALSVEVSESASTSGLLTQAISTKEKSEIKVSPRDLSALPKDHSGVTSNRKRKLDTSTADENNEIDVPVRRSKRVSLSAVGRTKSVATTQIVSAVEDSLNKTCVQCGKTLSNRANYIRHLKLHSDQRQDYFCRVCNKQFREKFNAIRHLVVMHSSLGNGAFKCQFCNLVFVEKENLSHHINLIHSLNMSI